MVNTSAENLANHGFSVIPLDEATKKPAIKGWVDFKATAEIAKNYDAFNIPFGIVCNNGVVAIDVDITIQAVSTMIDQVLYPLSKYVRQGRAPKNLYVFRTDDINKKLMSKVFIAPNGERQQIEVLSNKQQFVAKGTHVKTGNPYVWLDQTLDNIDVKDLPYVNAAFIEQLFNYFYGIIPADWHEHVKDSAILTANDTTFGESDAFVACLERTPPVGIPLEEASKVLSVLSAEDYQDWVENGMALHHEFEGSIEALQVWEDWSSKASNYDPTACTTKWESFNNDENGKTFATVLMKHNALVKVGAITTGDKFSYPFDAESFVSRFCLLKANASVLDKMNPTAEPVALTNFKNNCANRNIKVMVGEKEKTVCLADTWKANLRRVDVEKVTYYPKADRLIVNPETQGVEFNRCVLPVFEATEGYEEKCLPFLSHLKYIIPDDVERLWFLQWIAYTVIFPEFRCKVTPLHISNLEGTGRGFVVEVIQKLVGNSNTKTTKTSELANAGSGGFNNFLADNVFCTIGELKEDTGNANQVYSLMDNIRDILTEDYLEVNMKFGAKGTRRIFTNFFFMTNHSDALHLKATDRRIYPMSGATYKESRNYFKGIYNWAENMDNIAALYQYLANIDLTDFDFQEAPMSDFKRETIGNSQSELSHKVMDYIETIEGDNSIISVSGLKEILAFDDPTGYGVKPGHLAKVMQDLCYFKVKKRIGKKAPLWYWVKKVTV